MEPHASEPERSGGPARAGAFRLAIVVSHPIEFHVPIYRALAKDPRVDLTVYYCSDWGIRESYDPAFNRMIRWDVPLLEGYRHVFLPNRAVGRPSFRFWGLVNPGIVGEVRRGRFDAVNVFGYVHATNWLAIAAALLTRTPLILRGEADLDKRTSGLTRAAKRIVLTLLFRHIDAFLYSYGRNKQFFRHYGAPEEKLFFHPCAVDNDFFQGEARRLKPLAADIKRSVGIARPDLPVILFSGTLIPRKRPQDLLAAFRGIASRANLVLMGDGALRGDIERFVRDMNIPNVYLVGFKNQSEISMFHSIADVFALPSEYDPSPKVMNEAMNFALPVVTTDKVGTGPDMIREGENGFIYRAGDVAALADRLARLVDDKALRERMGAASLAAVNEWSIGRDARAFLEALTYVHGKRNAA